MNVIVRKGADDVEQTLRFDRHTAWRRDACGAGAQDRDVEIRALRAGAGGFLSKNANIEAVVRALRSVAGGEAAVTRSLTNHLVQLLRSTAENGSGMRPVKSPLTTREWEVLDLICAGESTREISAIVSSGFGKW